MTRFAPFALGAALFMTADLVAAQGLGDVQWCFWPKTNNRIFDEPMDKGYCAWVAAGSAVGVWFSPEVGAYVLNKRQNEWSRDAAALACSPPGVHQQYAVGLIAACQCHNQAAADWVLNNPSAVLNELRRIGASEKIAGCGGFVAR